MIRQLIISSAMVACAALPAAHAQDTTPPQNAALQKQEIAKGEPARWSQADATKAERERTLRKEIGAALAEAKQACQKGAAADRSTCQKDAQATYQHDLATIPQLLTQSQ
ncbi:hypothetical protein GTP46_13985 [Duganella sp. FT135W]|uniref:UrcA family protein n=1 Tax=Duganella flavida TaxID=2692175 RepID=A0A6L8K8D3_9BURK|nr:hypothetical protein [Duganella flavida]MYM23759.1 hypothetical protein [Duganella flavida]